MKAYRGRRGIARFILILGDSQRHAHAPLHPGKEPRNPLNKRRGAPGHFREEKNLLSLPGIKPSVVQPPG
jgi:hypothetical protein